MIAEIKNNRLERLGFNEFKLRELAFALPSKHCSGRIDLLEMTGEIVGSQQGTNYGWGFNQLCLQFSAASCNWAKQS